MDKIVTTFEAADIETILKLLPHRYPFLMVDRIVNMHGDESGIGIKNVTINEPQFLGHFPGNPVFPGVLLIEGMAQTAGAMCILSGKAGGQAQRVYFMTIDKAKFRKPVMFRKARYWKMLCRCGLWYPPKQLPALLWE